MGDSLCYQKENAKIAKVNTITWHFGREDLVKLNLLEKLVTTPIENFNISQLEEELKLHKAQLKSENHTYFTKKAKTWSKFFC